MEYESDDAETISTLKLTAVYCTLLGFHPFLTCFLFPQAVFNSESSPFLVYWLSTLNLSTNLS